MTRFTACLIAIAVSLPASPAHADTASKQWKVREMLAMLHLEETTNRMLQSQEQRIQAMSQHPLAGATLNTEQKEHYAEFQEKVVTLLRYAAGWKTLQPDYVKLYSDTYTETELDGILQFYRSPAGKVMLANTPELTEKSITILKKRMEELTPKIQELVDKFMREME